MVHLKQLGCIGEKFGESSIVGVVLSIRRNRKAVIEMWMRARDEDEQIKVGEELRKYLELNPDNLIFYYKSLQKSPYVKSLINFQVFGK